MLSINPYLHFAGNAMEAMRFYRSVLGGEFTNVQRYGDLAGGGKIPAEEKDKLVHISLYINGITIMATDVLQSMQMPFVPGNNFHICIQAESDSEVDRLFDGLAEDGEVSMPLNKTFWGAYFGMCTDKFGVQWMINCDNKL